MQSNNLELHPNPIISPCNNLMKHAFIIFGFCLRTETIYTHQIQLLSSWKLHARSDTHITVDVYNINKINAPKQLQFKYRCIKNKSNKLLHHYHKHFQSEKGKTCTSLKYLHKFSIWGAVLKLGHCFPMKWEEPLKTPNQNFRGGGNPVGTLRGLHSGSEVNSLHLLL